jgi:protein-L-isoaspartate(D-aspartate) O-methyltransferase
MNVEQARFNMIEQQIRPWDVLDTSVLSLLSVVRREDFVPAVHSSLAFMDLEIPLPGGRFMLTPKLEARMVQDLNLSKRDNVLLVGAGTGYVAALLAHKCKRVIGIERSAELASMARNNLRQARVNNAEIVEGNGRDGLPGQAPFDAILIAGSVTDLPPALLEQLKPGGRLLAVVGREPVMQGVLYTKSTSGQLTQAPLFDTVVPPLDGATSAQPFRF